MKPLYLLYHVPKTGGQTLRDHLDAHLVRDRDFIHLGRWDRDAALPVEHIGTLNGAERDALVSIGGHPANRGLKEYFPDRTIREVVFVREPAARMVSHYNFNCTMRRRSGRSPVSFEEFLAEAPVNPIVGFLSKTLNVPHKRIRASTVLSELASIWMVGRTESLDTLAPALFEAMGLEARVPERSNATGVSIEQHLALTPEITERIHDWSPEDVVLYAACRRLEQRTMERLGLVTKPAPRRPVGFAPT